MAWEKLNADFVSVDTERASIAESLLTERYRPTGRVEYPPVASFRAGGNATISLEIDDEWESSYTEAFADTQARNLPLGLTIDPDVIGETGNMTWSEVEEMHAYGTEVSLHSAGINMATDDFATTSDFLQTQEDLLESHDITPRRLVCSGGPDFESRLDWRSPGGRLCLGRFSSVGGVKRDKGSRDGFGGISPSWYDQRHQIGNMDSQADVEQIIDAIASTGGHVTLYWHAEFLGDTGYLTRSEIQNVLDKIETMRNNGTINVVSPSSGPYVQGNIRDAHINGWPGFEDTQALQSGDDDRLIGTWADRTGDSVINTSQSRNGSNSLELAASQGGVQMICNVPNVTQHLMVEGYVKSKNTDSAGEVRVYNNVSDSYPNYSGLLAESSQTTTNSWAHFGTVMSTRDSQTAVQVDVRNIGNNPILVDDLYVYPV